VPTSLWFFGAVAGFECIGLEISHEQTEIEAACSCAVFLETYTGIIRRQ
jgi:hypothetical protein